MKNIRALSLILSLILFSVLNSCGGTKKINENKISLPQIIDPTYERVDYGSEKGYAVTFKISEKEQKPTDVVIFGVRKEIKPNAIKGENIGVYVVHQTQKFADYKVVGTDLPDGVMFEVNGTKYLKKVNFKSVKK